MRPLFSTVPLLICIAIFSGCSEPSETDSETSHRETERFFQQYVRAVTERSPDLPLIRKGDLDFAIDLQDGGAPYPASISYIYRLISEYIPEKAKQKSIIDKHADGLVATVKYLRENAPRTAGGPTRIQDVLQALAENWPENLVVSFEGEARKDESLKPKPERGKDGWAHYRTMAEMDRRGRFLTQYAPLVQSTEAAYPRQTEIFKTVLFDGNWWLDAEEKSGWLGGPVSTKKEASVGKNRRLSDFYHENALCGLPAYWRVLGQIELREVVRDPSILERKWIHVRVEDLSPFVRVTFASGIFDEGFSMDVLDFDPRKNWAMTSGSQRMAVSEDNLSPLDFEVQCRKFKKVSGSRMEIPSEVIFQWNGGARTEHQLKDIRVEAVEDAPGFAKALGPEWVIRKG